MRILHLDCFSGISGDMMVGALRDLGVGEEVFQSAIAALGLGEEIHTHFHRVEKLGITAWKFNVHAHPDATGHSHVHTDCGDEHHHHPHGHHVHGRSWAQIRMLLQSSALSGVVKEKAVAVFERIAVAEARIHGVDVEDVGFHEVGAADSIADIVAACAGWEALGRPRVTCSSLVEGNGWVDCAHGRFPVPAPATLEILRGVPLRQIDEQAELITPTGAALVAVWADSFGPMPPMVIEKTGFGAGARNHPARPNVLRIVCGDDQGDTTPAEVACLETNLDDMTPEMAGAAMERLFDAGALDVFFTPVQMKKNRPGFQLTVLCRPDEARRIAGVVLRETSAFGVRCRIQPRFTLRREIRAVETAFGPVNVKLGFLDGERVQAAPEFESCNEAARLHGISVQRVAEAARAALG